MFSFPLAFISSWFYFFVFLFLQIFSLLIAFAHFTVSSLFVRYFVFVLLPQVLRIWENVFYSQAFLPYFPFWFYQGFPGASSSALRLQDFSLRFETQIRPICFFESYSIWQKVLLVGSIYVLEAAMDYYMNYLFLVLNSLY